MDELGADIDASFKVVGDYWPMFRGKGKIRLGAAIMNGIDRRTTIEIGKHGTFELQDGAFINDDCRVYCHASVKIEHGAQLACGVTIMDTNFHALQPGDPVKKAPVRIGRYAWIGAGAIILPGADIGDFSIVGAGSVVTRSVPASTLAAGNPCRSIRGLTIPNDDWKR